MNRYRTIKNSKTMNQPANNPPTVSSSRRRFLKQAVGSSTVFAVPNIFTGSLFGLSGRAIAEPVSPGRMHLAFSSVMLAELPIEEVCARAAQMGFEAIDIWCPFDNCKHLADVVARLGPDGLKALLAKHNLALASFTTYRVGPETVGFPAYADFIGKFGGGVVVRESEYKRVKPEDLTSAMRAFFEKLKPQIEKAAETKVRLAIENHGDALLNSPDSFRAFIDLNPAPQHVGLGIAPYHLQSIKAPVDEVIRMAGSQLLFFYAWQAAGGMKQLPGHGPADFVPWLRALARINYQGFVNPFMHGHPTPEELSAGLTQSCTYLKDCHQKATA